MEKQKLDRRERRTRQALAGALIALMQEKPYDAITVQDLIDRADVGRSTFYAHYQDKEDLFATEFQAVLTQLLGEMDDGGLLQGDGEKLIPSLRLFRHFEEHQPLYRALVRGRGLDTLYRATRGYFVEVVARRIARLAGDGPGTRVPPALVSDYLAGALLNLAQWWFENRMPYPPERMDEIFQGLAMPGLWAALGGQPGKPSTSTASRD